MKTFSRVAGRGRMCLDDLTSYTDWNFHVPGIGPLMSDML